MGSVMYRERKVESLSGFRVFAKIENRDGQIRDLNAAPSSDNHEDNRENFVIGHNYHLPLYGRGEKPSAICFLPAGSQGLHWHYNRAVIIRQIIFCKNDHFSGGGKMVVLYVLFRVEKSCQSGAMGVIQLA